MTPTYVFAALMGPDLEAEIAELIRLSENPGCHEDFSVFRFNGHVPLVSDFSLRHLRKHEADKIEQAERRKPKPPAEPFSRGQEIKVPAELRPYASMSGIVKASDGKHTWLDFGGIMGRVQIDTFRLREEREAA